MTLEEMRIAKQSKGYTIAQLAELTHIPIGTLQKIFSGETKAPRYATMQAIEHILNPMQSGYSQADHVAEPVSYGIRGEKLQGQYTTKDYYEFPEERRVELIDGVIYDMSAPSAVHQDIVLNVAYQLRRQIREKNGTCKVMIAPVDVQIDCDDRTMVQPDVMILCDKNKIRKWGILGAPDFVLEVISDSTKKKDYFKKMMKYMEAGVKEYWIVNPYNRDVIIYNFLSEDGPKVYQLSGEVGLNLYDGGIQLDLGEVNEEIIEYPEQ